MHPKLYGSNWNAVVQNTVQNIIINKDAKFITKLCGVAGVISDSGTINFSLSMKRFLTLHNVPESEIEEFICYWLYADEDTTRLV